MSSATRAAMWAARASREHSVALRKRGHPEYGEPICHHLGVPVDVEFPTRTPREIVPEGDVVDA